MTDADTAIEAEVLEATLATVLNTRPDATVVALAENGDIVAVPQAEAFRGHSHFPVPAKPAGMLGLVVPADRAVALRLWENCRSKGIAKGTARMLAAPDRPIRFMLIDARDRYGVRLCIIDPDLSDHQYPDDEGIVLGSTDALRPKTGTLRMNLYGEFTAIDERAARMLDWTLEHVTQQRALEFLHPDDHQRAIANWLDFTASQQLSRIRCRYRRSTGEWLWVELEFTYHPDDDPAAVYVIAQLSDISDEMSAHEAVDQREKLFRRLTESLPMGLFLVHTDGTVAYTNGRLPGILGVPAATTLQEQLATVAGPDRTGLTAAFTAVLTEGIDLELEVGIWLPDAGTRAEGERRRCQLTLTALSDQEGLPGAIVTVSDVTEAARMREELQHQASFDHLTGCQNRASTVAALELALTSGSRPLAVVFVDLDRFKPVNDELGHAAGDELLQLAASSLQTLSRTGDIVGRIGGDEFLLIFQGVDSVTEAMQVGERVSRALHHQVTVAGKALQLKASVGVALSWPGVSADSLVALADAAMYESKHLGDGTAVLSDPKISRDHDRTMRGS